MDDGLVDCGQGDAVTPNEWATSFAQGPVLDKPVGSAGILRRWIGTPATICQPRLDHHYLVLHLGGAKRVTRRGGNDAVVCRDVADRSLTVVPAGNGYRWNTEGPVDYAHYYLTPTRIARAAEEIFDKDGRSIELRDCLGHQDPLLSALFEALIADDGSSGEIYIRTLDMAIVARLIREHSSISLGGATRPHYLAPHLIRRVKAYVDAHIGERITLETLAHEAGLSRFHFARSFAAAVGIPPASYVEAQRLERAKLLLRDFDQPIAAIAAACGFSRPQYLVTRFRAKFGVTPRKYRNGQE